MSITRRTFLYQAALLSAATAVTQQATAMTKEQTFIHHVYFWLNNPESKEDKAALIAGLKKLSVVKTIASFHIGEPAPTNRDVIDRSYSVSWCLFFKGSDDQASYQVDPIHLNFVKECSHLWKKVVVYDSIDI